MAPKTNMGAGWLAAQDAGHEPQRQSNFEVHFYGLPNDAGVETLPMAIDTASLPNVTFGELEINHLNERAYIAGGITVETIPLVCKDFVNTDIMDIVDSWRLLVHNPANGRMGLARDYKKRGAIFLYGPDGGHERKFELRGCWPQAVNYGGTLDQSAKDAMNTIEVTIRYDMIWQASLRHGPAQSLTGSPSAPVTVDPLANTGL
jgi:hypothetical protein